MTIVNFRGSSGGLPTCFCPISRAQAPQNCVDLRNCDVSERPRRLVFVSHSGEDTWVAKQIARAISERGARPFLDEADIDIGAEFEGEIRKFLRRAHELLVLFTPWALDRPYVWIEIGAAWGRNIPIVVVLHGLSQDEFRSHTKVPVFLKGRNIVRLNEIEDYFAQLSSRVMEKDNG